MRSKNFQRRSGHGIKKLRLRPSLVTRGFFRNFSRGWPKVVKFVFSHWKLEINLFF